MMIKAIFDITTDETEKVKTFLSSVLKANMGATFFKSKQNSTKEYSYFTVIHMLGFKSLPCIKIQNGIYKKCNNKKMV